MSYRDRLRTLSYTAPSGASFSMSFDDLSRSGSRKVSVSESPDRDIPSFQDLGLAAQAYPIACYFSGKEYDKEADRFYKALCEKGTGQLTHPRWGNIEVIPLKFSQVEKFVDGASRAIFEIDFVKASESTFPTVGADNGADLEASIDAANLATQAGHAVQYGS